MLSENPSFSYINSIAAITYIKWIKIAGIENGPYCVAQASFIVIGHPSVALACVQFQLQSSHPMSLTSSFTLLTLVYSNLAISLETFHLIVLRGRPSYKRCFLGIGLIWLYVTILEIVALVKTYKISEGEKPFLGDTGLCRFLYHCLFCSSFVAEDGNRALMRVLGCSTTSISGHLAKYVTYWLAATVSVGAYGSIAWTLRRRLGEKRQSKVAHMML